jgi:hypothetical protein
MEFSKLTPTEKWNQLHTYPDDWIDVRPSGAAYSGIGSTGKAQPSFRHRLHGATEHGGIAIWADASNLVPQVIENQLRERRTAVKPYSPPSAEEVIALKIQTAAAEAATIAAGATTGAAAVTAPFGVSM